MAKAPAKVLYFTDGSVPTSEDYTAAESIGRGVVFRNARKIVPGAPLENCDAVAGKVPPDYAAIYPSVEKADAGTAQTVSRPNPSRTASSGGPDDPRPGTIDTGFKHESGTGSNISGDPYQARVDEMQRNDPRQGQAIWEKNPERKLEPAEIVEQQSGAWPGQEPPLQATTLAEATAAHQQEQLKTEQKAKAQAEKTAAKGEDTKKQ